MDAEDRASCRQQTAAPPRGHRACAKRRWRPAPSGAGTALWKPEHRAPPDPEPRMYRWGLRGPPEMIGAGLLVCGGHAMASAGKYRGRIVRPIPYEDGSGSRLVAPVGSYDIAEVGEHLQFFAEGNDPFQMPKKHALAHHRSGHLEIED